MRKNSKITKGILESVSKNSATTINHIADFILGTKYDYYRQRFLKSYIKRRFNELIKKSLIAIDKEDGKNYVRLTDRGKKKLEQYELGEMTIEKPYHWDGKWRLVIFDIRERRKGIRERLRNKLKELGLIRLQNSVWIHPYDFSEVLILFKADAMIGKDILYLTVEDLENDHWLKKEFNL